MYLTLIVSDLYDKNWGIKILSIALVEVIGICLLCREEVFDNHVQYTSSLFNFSVLLCADLKYVILFSGLDVDGIYRVSGNLATIQKLKFIVNQGK